MRAPDAQTAADASTDVFEGKVVSKKALEGDQLPKEVEFTFEVVRRWKGDASVGQQITLRTNDNSAACGREYAEGESYLVYANAMEGQLRDNLCSRTMTSAEAEKQGDFEALGTDLDGSPEPVGPAEPEAPRADTPEPAAPPTTEPPPTEASKQGCAVADDSTPLAPLALLPIFAVVGVRRSRARR